MLPRATHTRIEREAARGRQSGRTQEIQRLIGRCLRAAFDLQLLGERTLHLDCDVIQADGGTRTAAITGALCFAALDAVRKLVQAGLIENDTSCGTLSRRSRSVSYGLQHAVLDLDYVEDSHCETDMNVVVTGARALRRAAGYRRRRAHQGRRVDIAARVGSARAFPIWLRSQKQGARFVSAGMTRPFVLGPQSLTPGSWAN